LGRGWLRVCSRRSGGRVGEGFEERPRRPDVANGDVAGVVARFRDGEAALSPGEGEGVVGADRRVRVLAGGATRVGVEARWDVGCEYVAAFAPGVDPGNDGGDGIAQGAGQARAEQGVDDQVGLAGGGDEGVQVIRRARLVDLREGNAEAVGDFEVDCRVALRPGGVDAV